MIIDAHPHIFVPASQDYPVVPVGGQQSAWSQGISLSGADLAGAMAAAGVAAATIVQASTVYGYDNSYLADAVAARRGTFAGVCSVDPIASDAAARLGYWIGQRALHGVRLFATSASVGTLFSPDDPGLGSFWSQAERLRIPVDIQTRHNGLAAVRRVLERHPAVPVILDHLASPQLADGPPYRDAAGLFDLANFGQLYLKFTNRNLDAAGEGASTATAFLECLVDRFGANRIMWGSNFPNVPGAAPATAGTYVSMVSRVTRETSTLGAEVQDWLLAGTALKLYPSLTGA